MNLLGNYLWASCWTYSRRTPDNGEITRIKSQDQKKVCKYGYFEAERRKAASFCFSFFFFFTSTVHLFSSFRSDGKLTEKQTSILFHLFSHCGSRLNIWEYLTRYPWELRFTSYLYVNSNGNYHQKVVFLLPVWGFPCGSAGKESACIAGDLGSVPGLGWSPGYPLQYSSLENSMDYTVSGVTKSRTWLSDFHFTCLTRDEVWFNYWRSKLPN